MANRLCDEKSPYLLQHAENPVDWHPWGPQAFERAAREDRPVFLSVGYSTCHWCHVMAHESFEDPEVAALMNEAFVNIKVDREERPEIDSIYMAVCQMLTGGGGWPLTIVMTPDKRPFFAATYIPRESRFGRAGMLELVPRIRELWRSRRGELVDTAARITEALGRRDRLQPGEAGEEPGPEAPLLVTGNSEFSLAVVTGLLARTVSPFYLLLVDTRGDTVDMAMIYRSYTPQRLDQGVEAHRLAERVRPRQLIIPGVVAPLKEELAAYTGWDIRVGPICVAELPLFLGEAYWQPPGGA